jgi:putative transposase
MPNYRRVFVSGGCWFFTVNLLDRNSRLLVEHTDALREAIHETRRRYPFHIDAMVILPDHMHAVWTLPEDDTDFPGRWRYIKVHFSKAIPKGEKISATRRARGERGIWQRRYWEHLIRNERDYLRHVNYCWFNPVKHGLVANVEDWPFSSFHRDMRDDPRAADFGAFQEVLAEHGRYGERDT